MRIRLVVLALLAAAAPARAGEPMATKVPLAPGMGRVSVDGTPDSQILYLNRCRGGCDVEPGQDDARVDRSSVPSQPSHLDAFDGNDNAWARIVDCVTALYAPFGLKITDVDPGDTPHFEAMVAGRPQDVGMGSNVGGVAPFTCGVIENAISFTFANVLSGPETICEIIGQESAHTFGLDHELLCDDPMTYLNDCGPKCFRDEIVDCGEYESRPCYCGPAQQNSYQYLLDRFGPGPGLDGVRFEEPRPGSLVLPGFHVRVEPLVPCPRGVQAWIEAKGGDLALGEIRNWPYVFDSPDDLPLGALRVRVEVGSATGETYVSWVDFEVTDQVPDAAPHVSVDAGTGETGGGGGCAAGAGAGAGVAPLLLLSVLAVRRRYQK
ncbi:MAG TPA: hypothetical protein VL172_02775 [Kofleriaceae bacterium]|nr:hypothetical protein [Kofleriaceae bacterium]